MKAQEIWRSQLPKLKKSDSDIDGMDADRQTRVAHPMNVSLRFTVHTVIVEHMVKAC